MSVLDRPVENAAWYAQPDDQVASQLGVDPKVGLSADEVERRLAEYGPNEIAAEPPSSKWVVARAQLANPMNIMLLIVGVATFIIGQVATGLVVTALVKFNVIMATVTIPGGSATATINSRNPKRARCTWSGSPPILDGKLRQ